MNSIPTQQGDSDCGAFICFFAKAFLQAKFSPNLLFQAPIPTQNQMRYDVAQQLLAACDVEGKRAQDLIQEILPQTIPQTLQIQPQQMPNNEVYVPCQSFILPILQTSLHQNNV